jgi:4-amino-4-deoxy-L-arabinose transferase-like glycosyltransferase
MNLMRGRFTATFTFLGALFCVAALVGALSPCWTLRASAGPALAYACVAAGAAYLSGARPRRASRFVAVLVLVALAVRLAWSLTAPTPTAADDYGYYREVQVASLEGDWEPLIQTFFPWGYFLYLYALGAIFGPSLQVPVIANAIVGSATTLLVYLVARRLLEERNARVSAILYALWPGVIYWSGVYCSEIPHLFFFLAALFSLLTGLQGNKHAAWWLAAGGLIAALAEFIRPVSLLLLAPAALYTLTGSAQTEPRQAMQEGEGWRKVAPALGTYIVCLAALLAVKSVATGYPNFSASHTLGINLASGLNWESRGAFSLDDYNFWKSTDPREANRRGMQLARQHLKSLLQTDWWKLPALAGLKFRRIWSYESCGYDANFQGLTDDQKDSHWLARYGDPLLAAAQFYHTLILAAAALGFWRARRSRGLALGGCILVCFALLHTVIEVDDRYHFAAQSLLAVAAASAISPRRSEAGRRGETNGTGAEPLSV